MIKGDNKMYHPSGWQRRWTWCPLLVFVPFRATVGPCRVSSYVLTRNRATAQKGPSKIPNHEREKKEKVGSVERLASEKQIALEEEQTGRQKKKPVTQKLHRVVSQRKKNEPKTERRQRQRRRVH